MCTKAHKSLHKRGPGTLGNPSLLKESAKLRSFWSFWINKGEKHLTNRSQMIIFIMPPLSQAVLVILG
jgi:hypothetical protein